MTLAIKALRYLQSEGPRAFFYRVRMKLHNHRRNRIYSRWYDHHAADPALLEIQRNTKFSKPLLFSILVPIYYTQPQQLYDMAASFMQQSYTQWEACLYVGASNQKTLDMLHRLEAMDDRFIIQYGNENLGIAENTNKALSMAHGEYIALCDHDDTYTPDALFCFREQIEQTGAEVLYSDEDKTDTRGQRYFDPHFKPDFSPDLLRERNYICHLLVIKTTLMRNIGGLRKGFEGSQDHDLTLRACEQANRIEHIPRILYHWRMNRKSMSHQTLELCVRNSKRAVDEHIERIGLRGHNELKFPYTHTVYRLPVPTEVALVIVDRTNTATAERIRTLMEPIEGMTISPLLIKQAHSNFDGDTPVLFMEDGESLPSALNRAMKQVSAPLVVMIRSDVQPMAKGWLNEFVMHAQRKDVGLVTSVVYNQRRQITCAGYAVGNQRVVMARNYGLHYGDYGYLQLASATHNIAAAPWFYCAFSKSAWEKGASFDTAFGDQLFDVDFCLRLSEKGFYHVYVPSAPAVCGAVPSPTSDMKAVDRLRTHYPDLQDAFYSKNFLADQSDFSL